MEEIYSNTLEVNPQEVFPIMTKDIYNNYPISFQPNINKDFLKIRNDLIKLIHKISKKMGFKSQTFFLSIYYLDIILLENKTLASTNFNLLGLSCFIVASKYCENDPIVPPLETYLNYYNKYNSSDKKIKLDELFEMEVKVLKYLNYKMNYVSIYDFNLFFFNHGIIKKQQIKDIINNNINLNNNNKNNKSDIISNEDDNDCLYDSNYIKRVLEKIYKKSRAYLELVILNEKICFKYNVLLLSIYIMKKSIEEIILNEYKLKNKDFYLNKRQIIKKTDVYFKEVMYNFYKIDYESYEKYQQLIKDKNIQNIFPQQEKNEVKMKQNIKINLINFKKVLPSTKKSFKENNNYNKKKEISNNGIGISNLATSSTIEENKSPDILINNIVLNGENNVSQNDSKKKLKNIKINNALFEKYIKNNDKNQFFYTKTLQNNNYLNKNNNIKKNIINSSNYNTFIEKRKVKCTFTQLKNNLKKDSSINKKRCKDRYSHINNIQSLCKLTSCSSTIKNIKENNIYQNKEFSEFPENVINKENEGIINHINSIADRNSTNNILLIKNLRKARNLKNYFSKDKIKNLNIFDIYDEEDDLNESIKNECDGNINNNSNKNRNKNLKILKSRTKTLNKNDDKDKKNNNNINKLYFKKVIQNFEPKKKAINKNYIKININNILNNQRINNIKNNIVYNTTTNKNIDYIPLSNNSNNESKLELIRNRIKSINERNANLDNLLINKSNNIGDKIIKNINTNINNKSNLNIENALSKNSETLNLDKRSKIPKIPKNLKISVNFYDKYNIKNKTRYDFNHSPISFFKEIKTFNISTDVLNNKDDQEMGIRQTSSTIENTSSYHKKKVVNSLNKNKNKILNKNTKSVFGNTVDENCVNFIKTEGNSSYNKYKNAYISSNNTNNIFNKKIINNALNSFNTIDSIKINIERCKTIENDPL